jgi:hypothetical protein
MHAGDSYKIGGKPVRNPGSQVSLIAWTPNALKAATDYHRTLRWISRPVPEKRNAHYESHA